MQNIMDYVKENYEKLPKSSFNDISCVVVKEIQNNDHGWGHHSYEGIGVDENGKVLWCFSSGCSCNGSVNINHSDEKTIKTFFTDYNLNSVDPTEIDFTALQVSFSDY